MKHFFFVTTISFFTLSLYAVDSRLELPHTSYLEWNAYQRMRLGRPTDRAAGLATLVKQDSSLLNNLHVIKDVDGDLVYKGEEQSLLKNRRNYALDAGKFVVLHEGDELPLEFYPCIILGRIEKPTREELKTVYMPYTFMDHDDRARNEGSDDSDATSDGNEPQSEKEEERAIASEGSEDAKQEEPCATFSESDEEAEIEPAPCSRKRKRNPDAVMRAVRRTVKRYAVVRRNSVTIPCVIGTETLVTRVSKKKYTVQVRPLA